MTICLKNIDLCFEIEEGDVCVLTIENTDYFTEVLQSLYLGEDDEGVIFSEKGKILKKEKICECIYNPFAIDCNDRKIISKLYQELGNSAQEQLFHDYLALNMEMYGCLNKIMQTSPYMLTSNLEVDINNFFKVFNVRIDDESDDFLSRLINYIKVMHQICKTEVFVFLNIKHYFSEEEIEGIYEICAYEKVILLLIEGNQSKRIENEKRIIIDKDLCVI